MNNGGYDFLSRAGKYSVIIFIIWGIIYILDKWVFKTKILINCCSLPIALLGAIIFEFIVGFVFEVD
jgi:Cu/Ag efflux pump CusA